jgi:hypothetical protein
MRLTYVIPTQIEATKLSSYIEQNKVPRVDLIKIDVETHEEEVLQGFEPYLNSMRPTMLIEILNDSIGQRVENMLKGKNYLFFDLDEIRPPRQVEHITKSSYFNYLICSEAIAKSLKLEVLFPVKS